MLQTIGPFLFCHGFTMKQQLKMIFWLFMRVNANMLSLTQHLKENMHVSNAIVNLTMGRVFSSLIAMETA